MKLRFAIVIAGLILTGAMVDAFLWHSHAQGVGPGKDTGSGLSAVAQLGKTLFFDPALSASGAQSCATCHDPVNHYAPSNDLAVQLGGSHMQMSGMRAVPTLTYALYAPVFGFGQQTAAGDNDMAPTLPLPPPPGTKLVPHGGMFVDGRVDTLQEQAHGVLFSPFEMANADKAKLAGYVRTTYGNELAKLFGQAVLHDDDLLLDEAEFALARFQTEDSSFHPFSSKYDAYLAGKVELSPQEKRGLKLFEDPGKGNCAACHMSRPDRQGNPPLFTDTEFQALGVPRNRAIPDNRDPAFFDLGLCGPLRTDEVSEYAQFCGMFKTPTLRNVATRHRFFHNGVYSSLQQVMNFYARRDTNPAEFYPKDKNGNVQVFDDLPARYHGNVNRQEVPFTGAKGAQPSLGPQDELDIIAFLQTLTDGYAVPRSGQRIANP